MTTPTRKKEEAETLSKRGGENRPIDFLAAMWDEHRSVRLLFGDGTCGLATTAYSYALTDSEKLDAAERIAALWTLAAAREWSTQEIIEMAAEATSSSAREKPMKTVHR